MHARSLTEWVVFSDINQSLQVSNKQTGCSQSDSKWLCGDSGCVHSPEILIFRVSNNDFFILQYELQAPGHARLKLQHGTNKKFPPVPDFLIFLLCYSCLSPDALNRSWQTYSRERPGSMPAWRSRNSNLGKGDTLWSDDSARSKGREAGRVLWHSKVHHSQAGAGPACRER